MSRKLARRIAAAFALIQAVNPFQFSGGGIQAHHRAPRSRGGIDMPADHQRRNLDTEIPVGVPDCWS